MSGLWLSLSSVWKLQDIQAIISVITTALSSVAIYAFVRCCWQQAVQKVAKGDDIPLHSLLSINTIGEVLDVVILLHRQLICRKYAILGIQTFVVLLFSAVATFSGPVARFATKIDTVIIQQNVSGRLATRMFGDAISATVEWNKTYDRLQLADFPMDQLPDYLPNNDVDWVFEPSQWNNSWSLTCQKTPETNIRIEGTGNCTNKLALYELSGFEEIYNASNYDSTSWYSNGVADVGDTNKDVVIFFYAHKERDFRADQKIAYSESFVLISIRLHRFPKGPDNKTTCHFGKGVAESSSYSKIECQVQYQDSQTSDHFNIAFPDTPTGDGLPTAYLSYYWPGLALQSMASLPLQIPTPEELIRFYQTYIITKDVQYVHPVSRVLDINQPVVQISVIFLVALLFVAVLATFSLANYLFFFWRHEEIFSSTPDTKLDWIMQSIEIEDRPLASSGNGDKLRRSVTFTSDSNTNGFSRDKRRKLEFEAAVYGGQETTVWFLDRPKLAGSDGQPDSTKTAKSQGSNQIEEIMPDDAVQTVRCSRASTLNEIFTGP